MKTRTLITVLLTIAVYTSALGVVQADTRTWSSTAGSSLWSAPGNWVEGVAPVAGDDVIITNGVSFDPTTPEAGVAYNSVTWLGTKLPGTTITSPLTIGAGGLTTTNASRNLTLNAQVNVTANQTWSSIPNGTRPLSINGGIAGTSQVTFNDVGNSLFLIGANSPNWSGGAELRAGQGITMTSAFAAGTTATPFGTGVITLTDKNLAGTGFGAGFRPGGNFMSSSAPITIANDIVLNHLSGGGGFSLNPVNNFGNAQYVLYGAGQKPTFDFTGDISGGDGTSYYAIRQDVYGAVVRFRYRGNNTYSVATNSFGLVTNHGSANTRLEVYADSPHALGSGHVTLNPGVHLGGIGSVQPQGAHGLTFVNGLSSSIAMSSGLKPGTTDARGTFTIDLSLTSGRVDLDHIGTGGAAGFKTFIEFDLGPIGSSDKVSIFGGSNATDVEFVSLANGGNPLFLNNDGGLTRGLYTLFEFDENATYTGVLAEPTWGGSVGLPESWTAELIYNADSIQLLVIPEPAAIALLGLGAALLRMKRRRRRDRSAEDSVVNNGSTDNNKEE